MRNWRTWLLCALPLLGGWVWRHARPVARAAGVLAANGPVQADFDTPAPSR
jgi:hypothetical protein